MIVYAERELFVDPRKELAAEMDQIRFGQIEAGVADALCPSEDRIHPALQRFRDVAVRFPAGIGSLKDLPLPRSVRIRPAEGFAYYALYPEQYRQAARALRPEGPVVVVGVRSIGTTLSAVVAQELGAESITVRPRGHPFDRHLKLAPGLQNWIRNRKSAIWIVVDEGPGISGSSFASVSRELRRLGVPDSHIIFFPGWDAPAAGLSSDSARQEWQTHRRVIIPYLPRLESERDLSAGMWREHLGIWPAVQPQHERRKFLNANGKLLKFAGLSRFGTEKLERARILEGRIPHVEGLRDGFLISQFVEGRPLTVDDKSPELLIHMAGYLAFLRSRFTTSVRSDLGSLVHLVRNNTGVRAIPDFTPSDQVALDGRMLPHEWIQTPEGYLKTDALDHHDDHFFPGCQDIAWDIAGAMVEFQMSEEEGECFSSAYLSRCPEPDWSKRLQFHTLAYLAYRIGYVHMAQESLGDSDEARRFAALERFYRERMTFATGRFHSSSAS